MPSIDLGRVVGEKGTSLRNRGEWNSTALYVCDSQYIDLVTHKSSLWICLAVNSSMEPKENSIYWSLAAASIDTVYFTQATSRTNIVSGEAVSISFGKIKKWFADLGTSAFKSVSNALTTTVDGYVLDARQGKALNDKITEVNESVSYANIGGESIYTFTSGWSSSGLSVVRRIRKGAYVINLRCKYSGTPSTMGSLATFLNTVYQPRSGTQYMTGIFIDEAYQQYIGLITLTPENMQYSCPNQFKEVIVSGTYFS